MKREILFRGKVTKVPQYMQDKNRMAVGDWVYGSYVDYPVAQIFDLEDEYIVDPATVGQYTGLCDKDGKKIFEGDILKCVALSNDHHQKGAIVISPVEVWEGNACLSITHTPIYPFCIDHTLTIIGNIHDNPELAKEEAE